MSEIQQPPVLVVVGAGPKGLALAAKATVLTKLGLGALKVLLVERDNVAAHWDGSCGFTDGLLTLGTPPEKDVGFPYRSVYGTDVDREMMAYSWPMFLIETDGYSDWIDRGRPQPTHSGFSSYLRWVHRRCQPETISGTFRSCHPQDTHLNVEIETKDERRKLRANGVVYTGPGTPLQIRGRQDVAPDKILDGCSFWKLRALFQPEFTALNWSKEFRQVESAHSRSANRAT